MALIGKTVGSGKAPTRFTRCLQLRLAAVVLREVLAEAGFRRSTVYWQGSDEHAGG